MLISSFLFSLFPLYKELNDSERCEEWWRVRTLRPVTGPFSSSASFTLSVSLSSFHTFPRCSSTCLLVTLPSVVFPGLVLARVLSLSHIHSRILSFLTGWDTFPSSSSLIFSFLVFSGIHLNLIFSIFFGYTRYVVYSLLASWTLSCGLMKLMHPLMWQSNMSSYLNNWTGRWPMTP